jgi:hypothetical protein
VTAFCEVVDVALEGKFRVDREALAGFAEMGQPHVEKLQALHPAPEGLAGSV